VRLLPRLATFWGRQKTKYLSRLHLPRGYKLQVFHRGDEDPDPHDHPWDFWTFPLVSYYEEVWSEDYVTARLTPRINFVRRGRWHYRPAEYRHRVLGRLPRPQPGVPQRILTIIRTSPERRQWGFWVPDGHARSGRRWVAWRQYLGVGAQG